MNVLFNVVLCEITNLNQNTSGCWYAEGTFLGASFAVSTKFAVQFGKTKAVGANLGRVFRQLID